MGTFNLEGDEYADLELICKVVDEMPRIPPDHHPPKKSPFSSSSCCFLKKNVWKQTVKLKI